MKISAEKTHFTLDVLGRYTCNTDAEANAAMDRADARPFDVIVLDEADNPRAPVLVPQDGQWMPVRVSSNYGSVYLHR